LPPIGTCAVGAMHVSPALQRGERKTDNCPESRRDSASKFDIKSGGGLILQFSL